MGAKVEDSISKKINCIVYKDGTLLDSYKNKLGKRVKIVSPKWVNDCKKQGKALRMDQYLVKKESKSLVKKESKPSEFKLEGLPPLEEKSPVEIPLEEKSH